MNGLMLIRIAGYGVATLLLQLLLFDRLTLMGIRPDLVLVFIVWCAGFLDRTSLLLTGFTISFVADAMMDQWGLHMVSNTLLVLLGHGLIREASVRRMVAWQLLAAFFGIAVAKNLILIAVGSFVDIYAIAGQAWWRILLGGSLYTALAGMLAMTFGER